MVTKLPALPLPVAGPHVLFSWGSLDDPENCQSTYPNGTGMDDEVLDCHMRYMVATKDRLSVVYVENNFA